MRAFFVDSEIYLALRLNSQVRGVSGKNEQSAQTSWRGAQCSGIGLRPDPGVRVDSTEPTNGT